MADRLQRFELKIFVCVLLKKQSLVNVSVHLLTSTQHINQAMIWVWFVIFAPTVKSLKGCSSNPRGRRALFNSAWVWGMLVRVQRKVLEEKEKKEKLLHKQRYFSACTCCVKPQLRQTCVSSLCSYSGLQLTLRRSLLRLGSGGGVGLGGRMFLSWSRFTGLKVSVSSSETPPRPPNADDSSDRDGKGYKNTNTASNTFYKPLPEWDRLSESQTSVNTCEYGWYPGGLYPPWEGEGSALGAEFCW